MLLWIAASVCLFVKPMAAVLFLVPLWGILIWRAGSASLAIPLLLLPWLPNEYLPVKPVWIAAAAWAILIGEFVQMRRNLPPPTHNAVRLRQTFDAGDYRTALLRRQRTRSPTVPRRCCG